MVEMYLLIEVGSYFGAGLTIIFVMLTAMIGVALLKRQGLSTLTRGQERMAAGEMPAQEMAEGLMLAVSGALLLTPGFVTDAFGFGLLIPQVRQLLMKRVMARMQIVTPQSQRSSNSQRSEGPEEGGNTIEGEFRQK